MTKEEKVSLEACEDSFEKVQWLFRHHFDFPRKQSDGSYKTFIEMGLAVEASEDLYT